MNQTIMQVLLPGLVLGAMALVVLIIEAFAPEHFFGMPTRRVTAFAAILAFVGVAFIAGAQWMSLTGPESSASTFQSFTDPSSMLVFDPYTAFLTLVFCVGGVLVVLLSGALLKRTETASGEYYGLLLFATVGAYLMVAAHHLIMVFLGLEIMSIAIYPLAGFLRRDSRSNEAGLKYFLLGAFASSFLLYGLAIIYGSVGQFLANVTSDMSRISPLRFDAIGAVVAAGGASSLFWAGVALLLVGFSFKCGLAPFHQWTPDVYDGSPTPVTAYMGAVVKAAAFAPFFRFFLEDLGRGSNGPLGMEVYAHWVMIMGAIAILTMTWANLAAVAQPNLKRMLAYSSVAHAGYIVIALVAEDRSSLLFYLLAYTLMVVGSFGCAALLRRRNGDEAILIDEWAGVGLRYPWLGGAMALFMFALAGFPPTAGFMGKLYIFRAALEAGSGASHQNGYVALVAIALINSLVSVYYYLRVVLVMYRPETGPAAEYYIDKSTGEGLAIFLCAAGVLILGVFPQIIIGPLARVYGM